jgi:hypothetical protein
MTPQLTSQDVITALLAAGWRWEAQEPGLAPLLTNIPPDTVRCLTCDTIVARRSHHLVSCRFRTKRKEGAS